MTENNNLDKTLTSFEDGKNISMSDLMRNYDKTDMLILRMKSEGIIPKKEVEGNKNTTRA